MALASHKILFDVGVDAAFSETSLHKVPNPGAPNATQRQLNYCPVLNTCPTHNSRAVLAQYSSHTHNSTPVLTWQQEPNRQLQISSQQPRVRSAMSSERSIKQNERASYRPERMYESL